MAQPYAPPRDPTEVLGRRFVAFLIDALFLAVIAVLVFASLSDHSLRGAPANACSRSLVSDSTWCVQLDDRVWTWGSGAFARSLLLVGLAAFLDLVVLQSVTGASVGKLCVGLRVVEVRGNEARFLRVLGRWLFLIVDLGCFVVGFLTTLVTHPHRRVGDLVCGTYVVGVADVGQPVVVTPAPRARPAFGAAAGAPVPPGWGTPAGFPSIPPSAPVATPPGTSPTTPGEWGAVARPAPVVRAPKWEAPPPADQPIPVARDTMAPQWATPPGPKSDDPTEPEQHAVAEPMPAPQAAPEPLAAAPQWSPVVPLTTKDDARDDLSATEPIQPPPPPPAPWHPVVPASNGDPTPPPAPPPVPPAPSPPTEPSPPPPTEPDPPPPSAAEGPAPEAATAVPEDDDVPWWDADG
jgi:uncharacterized RDD family membrane protein YckC